jgi:hypothetical protein
VTAPNDEDEPIDARAALRSVASMDDEVSVERSVASILRRAQPELARRRRDAARSASSGRRRSPALAAVVLAFVFGAGVVGGVAFERTRGVRSAEAIRPEVAPAGGDAPSGEPWEHPAAPLEEVAHGAGVPRVLAPDVLELLELSPAQRVELQLALGRHARALDAIEQDVEPDIRQANATLDADLRTILDDVQRERLERIRRMMPVPTRAAPR